MKLYRYVGPKRIADRVVPEPAGVPIRSPEDVRAWVKDTTQVPSGGCVVATFVIDELGILLVADRRSEHVACAGRQPVQSAGEITFVLDRAVGVSSVSNQSTGYCPEPESWPAVAAALSLAGFVPPDGFALACVFRLCTACGAINLVKGCLFECGACGTELPAEYNCQTPDAVLSGAASGGVI